MVETCQAIAISGEVFTEQQRTTVSIGLDLGLEGQRLLWVLPVAFIHRD